MCGTVGHTAPATDVPERVPPSKHVCLGRAVGSYLLVVMMDRGITSLYVHVPFCTAKCDYCAFYSIPAAGTELRRAFLRKLREEFAQRHVHCCELRSVFVGGGTPSVLDEGELEALLGSIRACFRFAADAEFTVECNPGSLTTAKIERLAVHGVNRVSLGVQSFDEELRRVLGRRGDAGRRTQWRIEPLRAAGIENINVDLMYGIPGQTLDAWQCDVRKALSLGVRHLSTYALTLEEGTCLARKGCGPVGDELAVAMWDRAGKVARSAGIERYEISNLALPGAECRHNLDIWYGGTVLGCGPAASSFDGRVRWTNPGTLDEWLAGAPPEVDRIAPDARAAEILAFGLRTIAGWSRDAFQERTGFDYEDLRGEQIRALSDDGLILVTPERLQPTRRGLLFHDTVAERLL